MSVQFENMCRTELAGTIKNIYCIFPTSCVLCTDLIQMNATGNLSVGKDRKAERKRKAPQADDVGKSARGDSFLCHHSLP